MLANLARNVVRRTEVRRHSVISAAIRWSCPPRTAPVGSTTSAAEFTDEGFAFAREDNWDAAIEKYRRAIQADRTYARAYGNLGFALNRTGRHEEAIQICTDGLRHANTALERHRLHDHRGFAKSRLKDFSGAIDDFTAAIRINATNPKVFQHRAESHALAGAYQLAYEDVLRAIELDSEFNPALRLKERLESQGLVTSTRRGSPSRGDSAAAAP